MAEEVWGMLRRKEQLQGKTGSQLRMRTVGREGEPWDGGCDLFTEL